MGRGRIQVLQVTQDVQGTKDVSGQCLQVIVGQRAARKSPGSLKDHDQIQSHTGSSPMWVQLSGTHRWVKDFSPLKVNLERAQMSLFSMKLEKSKSFALVAATPSPRPPNQ